MLPLTWKTIKLGTGLKTPDEFRRALKERNCNIGKWADRILGNPGFVMESKQKEVELVKFPLTHLGFDGYCIAITDIYARAKSLGLDLCPSEVGPQLRLQYPDQPKGEWVRIGMELIKDTTPGNFFFAWDLRHHEDGRWLDGYADPGGWDMRKEFVFIRPQV